MAMAKVVQDPADLLGPMGRDVAVARRAAVTAEATAAQARDAAQVARDEAVAAHELAERCRRESCDRNADHSGQLGRIQSAVDRHSQVLEEHGRQLSAIRASGDQTKLTTRVVTALTALATALAAYLAASKPSAADERKTVSAVVAQAVDGTHDQTKALVAETVRELREDDRRREEAAMVEVRRMLARIEREAAPQRDPDEGAARARSVLSAAP